MTDIYFDGVSFNNISSVPNYDIKDLLDIVRYSYADDILVSSLENHFVKKNEFETESKTIIPDSFLHINTWIKSSNLKCWYCHLNFTGIPWFQPTSIEPNILENCDSRDNKNFVGNARIVFTKGNFCSCSCVYSYIWKSDYSLFDKQNYTEMLKALYEDFTGKVINNFSFSPDPQTMTAYGGYNSEEDYRKKIKKINNELSNY